MEFKRAETTGDLIGNKIADKIASVSNKTSSKKLPNNNEKEQDVEKLLIKKIRITRRMTTNYWWIKVNTEKLLMNLC